MRFLTKVLSGSLLLVSFLAPAVLHAGTPQTISFDLQAERLSTAAPFALTATSSSELPVSYSIVSI